MGFPNARAAAFLRSTSPLLFVTGENGSVHGALCRIFGAPGVRGDDRDRRSGEREVP